MLTVSEHIRRVLDKGNNFNLPAVELQSLLAEKGVEAQVGHIYAMRHTMKEERKQAAKKQEREQAAREADAARDKAEREAKAQAAEQRRVEAEVELQRQAEAAKEKVLAVAAKVQATKALNPQPLREHILQALETNPVNGLTIPEIISYCQATYKLPGNTPEDVETFKQNVRKKLRLMVKSVGEVTQQGDKYLATKVAEVAEVTQPVVDEVDIHLDFPPEPEQNGIVFLVGRLKEVVTRLGKNETKELIDILG